MLVLVLNASEDDRLIGKTEGLRYHRHNHGYLRCCTIDAQLFLHVYTFIYIREEHLVGSLIQDACNTQYEDGPRIAEHGTQQLRVESPAETGIFRDKTYRQHHRTHQVDIEGIAHIIAVYYHKIDDVEQDADSDIQQLQGSKLQGFLLLTQMRKGNAQEGINGNGNSHHTHIFRMFAIAHQLTDRCQQCQYQYSKEQ